MTPIAKLAEAIGTGFTDQKVMDAYMEVKYQIASLEEQIIRQVERIQILEDTVETVIMISQGKLNQGVPYYENIKPVEVRYGVVN